MVKDAPGLQVAFQDGEDYRFGYVLAMANEEWNHVAVVWDTKAGQAAVYHNGSVSVSNPIAGSSWVPDGQIMRLGRVGAGFRGVLDEIRLFGTPLGPEAIRDLYMR